MTSSPPASASTNPNAKLVRSADGMRIFAEATGSPANPHVVLVPGVGFSGCVFDDFCADERLLAALYIVRVDPRGCGRSDLALTDEMHESKRYAEDFDAVVKAFDLRHPVLVGWSYGGTWLTDIAGHLPPFTISGCMLLMGLPYAQELLAQVGTPALLGVIPGLLSSDAAAQRALVDLMFLEPAAPRAHVREAPGVLRAPHGRGTHPLPRGARAAARGAVGGRARGPAAVFYVWDAGWASEGGCRAGAVGGSIIGIWR
ncbi:hypothetical protein EVG20_g6291 [Dentipellis fragilis]|uniref:AB hydrolase-1 domain-containing protein n=1 Tax=Dentipellis fragilis TaxID=205917 RepID=A0A4Y9YNQ0_9AGAM|nr:hypothetical protein EVG20_g6291 [Dentipellis fragilis]